VVVPCTARQKSTAGASGDRWATRTSAVGPPPLEEPLLLDELAPEELPEELVPEELPDEPPEEPEDEEAPPSSFEPEDEESLLQAR
jgi:hypothetical protein